jgi:hypothetical protein
MSEPLGWAVSEESKYIFTCGEFIFNIYQAVESSIEDIYQYISPAEILDVFVDSFDGVNYYPILLCKVG